MLTIPYYNPIFLGCSFLFLLSFQYEPLCSAHSLFPKPNLQSRTHHFFKNNFQFSLVCIKNGVCGITSLILGNDGVHYNEVHTQMIIKKKKTASQKNKITIKNS